MRLVKSIYTKYNRFSLAGIRILEWTIHTPLQVILGTNGCGKSQLLRHTAPICAVRGEFDVGGGKENHYEHDGKYIIFKSVVGKKESDIRHFFSVDGEELQPAGGGTGALQKELARKYLGFDDTLHDILSGRLLFTDMGPQKRREVITKLSKTDLTYATQLYKKMQERHRDATGTKKRLAAAIASDTSRLLSLEATEDMVRQSHELQAEISKLMVDREVGVPDDALRYGEEVQHELLMLNRQATDVMHKYDKLTSNHGYKSPAELLLAIHHKQQQVSTGRALLENYTSELSSVQKTISEMELSHAASSDELIAKLAILDEQKERLRVPQRPEVYVDATVVALAAAEIRDLAMELGTCESPELNSQMAAEAEQRKQSLVSEIIQYENRAEKINRRLDFIRHSKDCECTKCGHIFINGVSDGELPHLEKQGSVLEQQIQDAKAKKDTLEQQLLEYNQYVGRKHRIRQVTTRYSQLQHVWSNLNGKPEMINNPVMIQYLLEEKLNEAKEWEAYTTALDAIKVEISRTTELLSAVRKAEEMGGMSKFTARAAELELNIAKQNKLLSELGDELIQLDRVSRVAQQADEVLNVIKQQMGGLEHKFNMYMKAMWNQGVDETLNKLQVRLAMIQSAVKERETLESKLKQLRDLQAEVEQEEVEWKILSDTLSPKSGLIASQLSGHIAMIVEQMNQIISQLWDYDLEVIPCGMESEELDYVFPVMIKDISKPLPDVKFGSTGQRDVVNFAFTIMVMIQQELNEYPLYLDEIGASFDDAHRRRLMEYIIFLIENRKVSQAFMVNHYSDMYNSIGNYETLVLDPTNIVVPDNANSNVVIVD